MRPIINISSENMILRIVKNMPQSILLYGKNGVGLGTIAKYIAQLIKIESLMILPTKDEKIDLEAGVIGIDIIRNIYADTRTKSPKKRLIIIDYAERMTHQAQNAFLKLLEEPNEGLYFILVSHSADILLPTILSRTVKLEIKPISIKQSEKLIVDLLVTDSIKQSQLLFMASGLPAEIVRLIKDEEYFKKRSTIILDAKASLTGSLYKKLVIAQTYKENRADSLLLLNSILSILNQSITSKPQIDTIQRIESVLKAYKQIEANGNIRLCLTRMFV